MAKKKKQKQKKQSFFSFRWLVVAFFVLASMIMFLPTTFMIAVGMLPTFVAIVVDKEEGKNKSFTIGAMNLAGVFPYLLGLWTQSNSMPQAMDYLADPKTIIVIYSAAAVGYLINWSVTMAVSSILVQRSRLRIKRIEEEKLALEERWGKKVNGQYELDNHGFVIERNIEEETA